MQINKAFSFATLIIAAILFFACGNQNKQNQPQVENMQTTESQEEVTKPADDNSIPDSVIVTVSMKGKSDRLNILQQKVMLMAKKKLADSLIKLHSIHLDTSVNPNDYEVSLRNMFIVNEGLRYPDQNNPGVIEAYITLGIEYDKN